MFVMTEMTGHSPGTVSGNISRLPNLAHAQIHCFFALSSCLEGRYHSGESTMPEPQYFTMARLITFFFLSL